MKMRSNEKLWGLMAGAAAKASVALAAVALACTVRADTYFDGKYVWNYKLSESGQFVEICSDDDHYVAVYPKPFGALAIPPTICGKPVVRIGEWAFYNCEDLSRVAIPGTVKSIGESAFYECRNLVGITLAHGVGRIERAAFSNCNSLKDVTIPDSVVEIETDAFCNDSALTSATLSANLKNIPEALFYNTKIGSAIIPPGVTSIETAAFSMDKNPLAVRRTLKTVAIPRTVESIAERSFPGYAPDVVYVANGDTERIRGLLRDSEGSIAETFNIVEDSEYGTWEDDEGHYWTYRITCGEAEIGNGVKSAIWNGTEGEVEIPPYIDGYQVTRIAANAFFGCSKLTAVHIPDSVKSIGEDAFCRCNGLANSKGLVIVRDVLYGYFGTASSVKVPSSVKRIVGSAFSGAKDLTDVTIGDSVAEIGDNVFAGCNALEKIHVGYGMSYYFTALITRPGTSAPFKFVEPSNPSVCTVSFDVNGGKECDYDAAGVAFGDAIGRLPEATRKGYSLVGWYTKKGAKLKTTDIIEKNAKYFARWTPNTYTIKYDANGGSGTMSKTKATYDKTVVLKANAFTRKNCKFIGWSKQKDATAATYANREVVKNLSSKAGGTVTLYAVWERYTYTVKFNANGGNGKTQKQKIGCGLTTALAKNEYTLDCYRFAGWSTKKGGPIVYKNKAKVKDLAKKGETVTLYAVWYPAKWATGTFTGKGMLNDKAMTVTLTVSSEGKISGKFVRNKDKKSGTFKANGYDYVSDDKELVAIASIKFGGKKYKIDIGVRESDTESDAEDRVDITVFSTGNGHKKCGWANLSN